MKNTLRSYDPVHVLLLTTRLCDLIKVMGDAAEAGQIDDPTYQNIAERVDRTTQYLQNIQRAAAEYGVDPQPFREYAEAWCRLWRLCGDPVIAIQEYLRIITNERVRCVISHGIDPLAKAAAIMAVRADTPVSIRLRNLSDLIRKINGALSDQATKMGELIIIAGICGDFARE